ncbi:WSC domain protein [Seiridium cupressi]
MLCYMQDALYDTTQKSKVKAFQPGFRIFIGDVNARTTEEFLRFRQLTYTWMDSDATRTPETLTFPTRPCSAGVRVNARFPTCWDGVNLDSPDNMAHMVYPEIFFEVVWDTSKFNNKVDWPEDDS